MFLNLHPYFWTVTRVTRGMMKKINNVKKCAVFIAVSLTLHPLTAYSNQKNSPDPGSLFSSSVTGPAVKNGTVVIDNSSVEYESHSGTLELSKEDQDESSTEMFYVAYFKKNKYERTTRPITFIYNGGPGSATIWLHMGALGPKRVLTMQPGEKNFSPYIMVDNKYSLLDTSDLVFIDAPGTGYSDFSSNAPTYQERNDQKTLAASATYSIKGDARSFKQFIVQFLTRYQRWGSPKYLFGESYGTTRSVVLAEELINNSVGLNGLIMMSPYMNYSNNADDPELNPGYDLPYILALPTYTAVAWYHKKIPLPYENLNMLLKESEEFAKGEYAQALLAGSTLNHKQRSLIADRLFNLTGIPAGDWVQNNLRLNGPVFAAKLLQNSSQITGRLDARYVGPAESATASTADYDPMVDVMSSPYLAAFHDYAAKQLGYDSDKEYRLFSDAIRYWGMSTNDKNRAFNVLPNLAKVMKSNPHMKVLFLSGVYDMATPYFSAQYDIDHMSLPEKIRNNITSIKYETGHMPYIDEVSLKKMHGDLKGFFNKN